jgi:signal transduction histidine kinase
MTLYRLTQEGVNNALKHARATRIDISLRWDGNTVTLEVADNGIGFSSVSRLRQGHFGLLNLRERVAAFGGTLQIDSQPGNGTRIRAQMPIQERNQDE